MGIPSGSSIESSEERARKREELYEKTHGTAKRKVSFSGINKKGVSEGEIVHALHEELSLNQMYKDYLNFLSEKEKLAKIDKSYYPSREEEKERKLLESRIRHFSELFWKNRQRFVSTYLDNYLQDYYNVLKNNPALSEKYSKISPKELQEKREKWQRIYNAMCIRMNNQTRRYASLENILIKGK